MRRRRVSVTPKLSSISDNVDDKDDEGQEKKEPGDRPSRPPPHRPPPTFTHLVQSHTRSNEKGSMAQSQLIGNYTKMSLPPGWRVVPSNSQQHRNGEISAVGLLRYENVYSGERYSICPTVAADADLPSRIFNVLSAYGQNLIAEQDANTSKLVQHIRKLNKTLMQKQPKSLKEEAIVTESSRIIDVVLSETTQGRTAGDENSSQYNVSFLYSAELHTEVSRFQPMVC